MNDLNLYDLWHDEREGFREAMLRRPPDPPASAHPRALVLSFMLRRYGKAARGRKPQRPSPTASTEGRTTPPGAPSCGRPRTGAELARHLPGNRGDEPASRLVEEPTAAIFICRPLQNLESILRRRLMRMEPDVFWAHMILALTTVLVLAWFAWMFLVVREAERWL